MRGRSFNARSASSPDAGASLLLASIISTYRNDINTTTNHTSLAVVSEPKRLGNGISSESLLALINSLSCQWKVA